LLEQKAVNEREIRIAPIFLQNGISSTVIIPISIARRKGLDRPCHVTIEETDDGIFIKKLDLNLAAKLEKDN
jgi:hypothetical protein